jgi:hypothetical protein
MKEYRPQPGNLVVDGGGKQRNFPNRLVLSDCTIFLLKGEAKWQK